MKIGCPAMTKNPDGTINGITEYPIPENIDSILNLHYPVVTVKNATMYGYINSTAHAYAENNNIAFGSPADAVCMHSRVCSQ
jgi:hypothetical protein